MYYWNFLFPVLLSVLNSIEADVRVIHGREHSCKRSLHLYPETSYDRIDVRHGKAPGFLVREEYRDLPLQLERDSRIQTRTTERRSEQSINVNRGLSRFQNHDRFRQRQFDNKDYSRFIKNQESTERFENLDKRRIVRNSYNLRTTSASRKIETNNDNGRVSSYRFLENRAANTEALRRVSMRDTRISSAIENRRIDTRKINGPEQRDTLNRRERGLGQSNEDSDKVRERVTSSVLTRQMKRESSSKQDVRNHQLTKRSGSFTIRPSSDSPTTVRPGLKNVAERRERQVQNEQTDRRVLSLRQRSNDRMGGSPLRPFVRSSLAREEAIAKLYMDREVTERRAATIQRSSDISQRSSRSLESLTVKDNKEPTSRVRIDPRAERTRTTQRNVRQRSNSRSGHRRNADNKARHASAIITADTRDGQRRESNRLNKNQRLSNEGVLREVGLDGVIRFKKASHLRQRSTNRPERARSTKRLKASTADVSQRVEDRNSDRRDQRTGLESTRRSADTRYTRDSNILHDVERKDNSLNRRYRRESQVERSPSLERSKKTSEEPNYLFSWQSALHGLQAIYICSIVFNALNKAEDTKKKTWSYSWLAVPINKID